MLFRSAWQYDAHPGKLDLGEGIRYRVETQGSFSKDKTPLWLNANKHGLSSLDETNGYVRATAIRPLLNDSSRRWGVGYGLDVAAPLHYTSNVVVQQAFVEGRWLHGTLTIGAKDFCLVLQFYHQVTYMTELCHIDIQCRLWRHILFTDKVLQKIFCPAHDTAKQVG